MNELRRKALEKLSQERIAQHIRPEKQVIPNIVQYPEAELDYRANVLNTRAEAFYSRHGAKIREKALESFTGSSAVDTSNKPVLTTRYCLRYELDTCLKPGMVPPQKHLKPPLRISDRRRAYRLEFDCRACCMNVIPEEG